jgi:hypothetical protein
VAYPPFSFLAMQWISTKDRLPDNCRHVIAIVLHSIENYIDEVGFRDGAFHPLVAPEITLDVAHWMPMPDPAEEGGAGWIAREERLPTENGRVITTTKYEASGETWINISFFEDTFYWSEQNIRGIRVTHWMPLPEMPGGGRTED